jgi:hypothetical protein
MKLQTQIPLTKSTNQIDYSSQLLLLGSCFSENMGTKLDHFKFQNKQNPLGILFHALAIEKLVSKAVNKESYTEQDVFFLNERWHCFEAHSVLSDSSKNKLLDNLNKAMELSYHQINKASHIIVTLGTAWVYRRSANGQVVANCHKVPQANFEKQLLAIKDIEKSLEHMMSLVHAINSTTQFIFTISPVRHLKDGFVENQLSKAHLISAVYEIVKQGDAMYFPSYEIMMDELRDYRFYANDMVHPSSMAIDYIWEKFCDVWVNKNASKIMIDVDEVQRGLKHRPFNPSSISHEKFIKSIQDKIAYIQKDFPFMNFNIPKT